MFDYIEVFYNQWRRHSDARPDQPRGVRATNDAERLTRHNEFVHDIRIKPMTVRRATLADVNDLATLNSVVQNLHVAALPDVFRPADHSGVADMIRSGIDRPALAAWLAEQDGTAVGYILTTIHERAATVFHHPRRILEVDQIGVLPDYQRHGIGRALFDCALQHARASGVDEVVLSAWAFNERAQTAFRRWGLTPRLIQFSLREH